MPIQFPCGICEGAVAKTHRAVFCDVCTRWIHIKCNNISSTQYNSLVEDESEDKWCCLKCLNSAIPFSNTDNDNFLLTNVAGKNPEQCYLDNVDCNIGGRNKELIEEISKMILHNQHLDADNMDFPCKYYDIEKIINSKIVRTDFFSIFDHNIHSLQAHIEELKHLLRCVDIQFDVIALSETKIQKNKFPFIDIPEYSFEHTPTEAAKGGTALYISKKLTCFRRSDLEIYVPKTVESTFVEVVYPNSKNKIIGCMYKRHNITEEEFADLISPVLEKINKENKPCHISGDFNVNLLNSVKNIDKAHFFNTITSLNFMPTITLPTRITSKSQTLIDNILTNRYESGMISGNITVGISDHIPQFLLIPTKECLNKSILLKTVLTRSFKNVNMESMKRDLENIDWSLANEPDPNVAIEKFFSETNKVLDKYAPLKKKPKKELKLEATPWITKGIAKSIQRKDKLYKKIIKEKNTERRINLEKSYKILKQKIFNIIRSSKKLYYKGYFEQCTNNCKKIWAGVNEIIQNKPRKVDTIDHIIGKHGGSITNKIDISNEFNSFFSGVADDLLRKRKYDGNKNFTEYLTDPVAHTIYLSPVSVDELKSILFSLNCNKANCPHSIPNEIFHSIAYVLAVPLKNICNNIFITGIFPDILKMAKVIVIHKKGQKLLFLTTDQYHYYQT